MIAWIPNKPPNSIKVWKTPTNQPSFRNHKFPLANQFSPAPKWRHSVSPSVNELQLISVQIFNVKLPPTVVIASVAWRSTSTKSIIEIKPTLTLWFSSVAAFVNGFLAFLLENLQLKSIFSARLVLVLRSCEHVLRTQYKLV